MLIEPELVGQSTSILETTDELSRDSKDDLFFKLLRRIVTHGIEPVLKRARKWNANEFQVEPSFLMPLLQFDKFQTIDPFEIDGLLSFRNIIENYLGNPQFTKPLSLGVFGPPGSGKNFAIENCHFQVQRYFRERIYIVYF